MEIKQKKLSTKHTFIFKDDILNFSFKDKSGADDFDLNYADFPDKSSMQIEQNQWLKNAGVLWCLIGVFQMGSAIYRETPLSGTGFWLFMGIICLIWFSFTKIQYSVFKSEAGNVFIIKDSKHDEIILEIKSRKKSQLLEWYGDINLENELENEINKFNWLVEQNVLTQKEAEQKIAQVEFSHKDESRYLNRLN